MSAWWNGNIRQPFKWSPGNTAAHSGTDLAENCGSVITSPVDGDVLSSSMKPWGGQVDILAHGVTGYPDPVVLSFLHLSREDVKPGPVRAGQQIGLSGQPPPGQGYGDGCHLHLEVSAGDLAPYTAAYSPRRPSTTNYPLDASTIIEQMIRGGGVTNRVQQAASSLNPFETFAGGILSPGKATTSVGKLGAGLAPAFGWIAAPLRIIKLGVGVLLIIVGLVITFLPDVAEGGAALAGFPQLAPLAGTVARKAGGPKISFAPTVRSANAAIEK